MIKGRHNEARRNLLKLHTPEGAAIEIMWIQAEMEIVRTLKSSYWAMFAKLSYRKRTLIGMATTASIQFSGKHFRTRFSSHPHLIINIDVTIPPRLLGPQ